MNIIFPDRSRRTVSCEGQRIDQILAGLGISTNEVIISKNGKLVPEDTVADGDCELRIIRIAHGG